MKLAPYLKDKLHVFVTALICLLLINSILFAFKVDVSLMIVTSIIFAVSFLIPVIIDYLRKKKFYDELIGNAKLLDKSYYVLETIQTPSFYEGKLLVDLLYLIDKSMIENVNACEEQKTSFKEYIEMWVHEIKIPLVNLQLIYNNSKNKSSDVMRQLKRLEDYVEQVLYYTRSENAEKDYLIKKTDLRVVIKNVGLKNMDMLLALKIDFLPANDKVFVYTDAKWLEFILGQIIMNSIKYKKDRGVSYIKISTEVTEEETRLIILDNGIGIKESDVPRVFDKSFTGENGRERAKSTGMGLYIAKSLCEKLGHKIEISSKYGEYTKVTITFANNHFYDVMD